MLSFDRLRNRFCSRGRAIGAHHRPRFRIALEFRRRTFDYDAKFARRRRTRPQSVPLRLVQCEPAFPTPDYRREHHTGFEEMAQSARSTPQDADSIEDRLQAILAFDARPTARSIECPTLICASEDDQLMPVWFARELASLMPAAQLLSLQGGGHMLPETRGETIAQAIIEFTAAHTD